MAPRHGLVVSRRRFCQFALGTVATAGVHAALEAEDTASETSPSAAGRIVGQPEGAVAGMRILAEGGNAVDAVVGGALVAGVLAISSCGIGGYGGHLVVGWPDGRSSALDFNSTAPALAREDMFAADARGRVRGSVNDYGWQAAGVPGTMAGLQKALDEFGTRRLDQVILPAIRFARDGFVITPGVAKAIQAAAEQFKRDEGSARLFFADGKPLAEGATFRNPALAKLLERLARDNSVADFYRGETAAAIAAAFQKNAGIVTTVDLASYQAPVVAPLALSWNGYTLYTAPLTAGGLSVLQTLATLRALNWETADPADPRTSHARIEALRLAWQDRLTLLGDPDATNVPVDRLLSSEYAASAADRVRQALQQKKLLPGTTDGRPADGTVHLSAIDRDGMMAALTLTHGNGFGARVTVDSLGLILGHGMSRFDPRPGHPNSPRAGRRPLNNMCPTVIFREGKPVVALGATGGRRIPNTMVDVLAQLVGRGQSLAVAFKAPRLHTEGDDKLELGKGWSAAESDYLKQAGYQVKTGGGANLNGVERDPAGALTSVP